MPTPNKNKVSFAQLGLSSQLLDAVSEQGYEPPTPIQADAIPEVIRGRDLLAGAQTGTGKTAGFVLPILQRLQDNPTEGRRRVIRTLILVPTRELAAQVNDSVKIYGRFLKLHSMVIFGGVNINPQTTRLRSGVDIVVATPGRLLDHIYQKNIRLDQVDTLVLDEADRMLDMGFIRDIRKILQALPTARQNLLFSATFSKEIRRLAGEFLDDPVEVQVAKRNATAAKVSQLVHPIDKKKKRALLSHLIREGDWRQVLVFTRTKHGANRLAKQLDQDGITATAIHGNKSQAARMRALAEFKQNRVRVLVATDIAARGLDIEQLPHVVNYELPQVPEDYVHRIGRTGRAGKTGHAVSLVCIDEIKLLRDIEKMLKRKVEQKVIAGFEVDPNVKPEPIQKRVANRRPRRR
ncbi:MAG: DEAD/DEAH box helicase [Planctomycetes bacterium]|nr:DEAD/DEAH box helicase [Planctomycetota bacterium]